MVYNIIYNVILHSNEKEWNLVVVTTWMGLEGIMLREMSERERQIPFGFTYIWNLKQNKQNKTRLIETETKGIVNNIVKSLHDDR